MYRNNFQTSMVNKVKNEKYQEVLRLNHAKKKYSQEVRTILNLRVSNLLGQQALLA